MGSDPMVKKSHPLRQFRRVTTNHFLIRSQSSKGSDPSVYVLLYMFASYHLPPQQFHPPHSARFAARPTASGDMRSSLILPANISITIIPPTTPHTPLLNPVNPVKPVQNFYTLNTIYTAIIFSFRVFRGSNLCVLCVLLDHRSLGEGGCGYR